MTTAHRPTFDPARGRSTQESGSILHARHLPAHTKLKFRQQGQGGDTSIKSTEELKQKLLLAEKEHFVQAGRATGKHGSTESGGGDGEVKTIEGHEKKRQLESGSESDPKKFHLHESDQSDSEEEQDASDSESDDDSDDEQALLQELERIKKERAEQKRLEQEKEEQARQQAREEEIAYGNPLLNPSFTVKRSWTDESVFKNQARQGPKQEGFVNDMLRSDFHRNFINKYIK
uniref:Pre-mRNA-splicing factor CWC15 n=1 Tax=Blastobotrys adeninivorans TaxID=409370 RepID=A0A060T2D0_BLAAD